MKPEISLAGFLQLKHQSNQSYLKNNTWFVLSEI